MWNEKSVLLIFILPFFCEAEQKPGKPVICSKRCAGPVSPEWRKCSQENENNA
jgi:hypothetical protein